MKRLILVCLMLFLLSGCREEGIIIETMTPSPPTSATEALTTTSAQTVGTSEATHETEHSTVPTGSITYVLNVGTKKFHLPTCSSATEIKAENRKESNESREALIDQGFAPCGRCDP